MISVVIPAYNAERFVERAVQSVLSQTLAVDEILIIDDGSRKPLSESLLDRPPVRIIRKPNGGTASARNMGISEAKGDWIAFLDADDYWEPQKIEWQMDAIRTHPEVKFVGSRWYEEFPGEPRYIPKLRNSVPTDSLFKAEGRQAFDYALAVWTGTVMVHRSVIGNGFTSGIEPAEDRDLWIQLLSRCPAFILSEPLATYVQEPGSMSRTHIDRDYGNMLRVVHRHRDVLGPAVREYESTFLRQWAGRHLGNGTPRKAIRPAIKRLKRSPLSAEAWWVVAKSAILAVKH
jgi:glycosyltransferase involved in cell wall biosynthesis